jgi:DNA-binding transcriptional LysR family regulator
MINPVHLRTLHAVIETGSFADAARLLGYPSSAVAQHISALERTSGLVLFDREPQRVRPTTAALVLTERAQAALTALEQVEQDAHLLAAGREGRIRLGAFTTASTCIVPPALASFTAHRPRADVHLVEGSPAELLSRVQTGDLDVVLVYTYDAVPREWPAELAVERIFTEELVLMMPISNSLVGQPQIRFHELADRSWIAPTLGSAGAVALDRMCAAHGFEPRIVFRSDNYVVIRALVRAGLGMALVPQLAHLSEPGIKSASLGRGAGCRHVVALYRDANRNPLLPDALRALAAAADDERLQCSAPVGWCQVGGESSPLPTRVPGEGFAQVEERAAHA